MANNKGNHEEAAERRVKALEMRKGGASYRLIGAQLGVSEKTAHQDVRQALANLAELEQATAEEYRALELARLDMAALGLSQKLKYGDPAVVSAWIRLSESRRKLLGLDAQPDTLQTGDMVIVVRWHDQNRMIDVTPDNNIAAAPSLTTDDRAEPGALSYRVRWSEMGQESAGGDAEPENGAGEAR